MPGEIPTFFAHEDGPDTANGTVNDYVVNLFHIKSLRGLQIGQIGQNKELTENVLATQLRRKIYQRLLLGPAYTIETSGWSIYEPKDFLTRVIALTWDGVSKDEQRFLPISSEANNDPFQLMMWLSCTHDQEEDQEKGVPSYPDALNILLVDKTKGELRHDTLTIDHSRVYRNTVQSRFDYGNDNQMFKPELQTYGIKYNPNESTDDSKASLNQLQLVNLILSCGKVDNFIMLKLIRVLKERGFNARRVNRSDEQKAASSMREVAQRTIPEVVKSFQSVK